MSDSIDLYLPEGQESAVDGDNFLHRRERGAALTHCGVPWSELDSEPIETTETEGPGYRHTREVFRARSPYICLGCWDLDWLRSQGVETHEVPRPASSWPGDVR